MRELTIIEQKENPLLERKTVLVKVSFEQATPSGNELKKELAKKLNVKEDVIAIKKINQNYGSTIAIIEAQVYKSADILKSTEELDKRKSKGEEKPAAGQAPAAPKAEEKPAEAPKEEKKE